MQPRVMVVGHGGAEAAITDRLAENSEIYAFLGHRNPSIVDVATHYRLGNTCDPPAVRDYAEKIGADIVVVSRNEPLAAGVVDELLRAGIAAIGPTRSGARIEWDKSVSRDLVKAVAPAANPRYVIVESARELDAKMAEISDVPIAVKPAGLSGGKGVKVMGSHLAAHAEARDYAATLLANGAYPSKVILEEKIEGTEFTINTFTDGSHHSSFMATYDYPYRFDGDNGPGTGGMGAYSSGMDRLPFMTDAEFLAARRIAENVLDRWVEMGERFTGVLNSGFMLGKDSLHILEFNARIGDPEAMNMMALLESDLSNIFAHLCGGRLDEVPVQFRREASVSTYLVAPDYALPWTGENFDFDFDTEAAKQAGCAVYFASCERIGRTRFHAVGSSRVVAIVATRPTLEEAFMASQLAIRTALPSDSPLAWRSDIGSPAYVLEQVKSRNQEEER